MEIAALPSHLNYLNDAAHLLRASAPESSAYLMSRRNEFMFHHGLEQTDVQRQHVCGSCGHIMIPGQGSSLKLEAARAIRKGKRGVTAGSFDDKSKNGSSEAFKAIKCGLCNETTRITLPRPPPITRRKTQSLPVKITHAAETNNKIGVNASSKKRAKSRKAGLQALLSQHKTSGSQSSRSLSLSDFMKK